MHFLNGKNTISPGRLRPRSGNSPGPLREFSGAASVRLRPRFGLLPCILSTSYLYPPGRSETGREDIGRIYGRFTEDSRRDTEATSEKTWITPFVSRNARRSYGATKYTATSRIVFLLRPPGFLYLIIVLVSTVTPLLRSAVARNCILCVLRAKLRVLCVKSSRPLRET